VEKMRIGKAIDHSHEAGVVPPGMPQPRQRKFGFALLAAVPAAFMLGAVMKNKKKNGAPDPGKQEPR